MAFKAKRQHPRVIEREGVRVVDSSHGLSYGTYEDISEGGLKLILESPAELGETLLLEFDFCPPGLSRKASLRAPVEVVRCSELEEGYEVGVKFRKIEDSMRGALKSVVDGGPGPF